MEKSGIYQTIIDFETSSIPPNVLFFQSEFLSTFEKVTSKATETIELPHLRLLLATAWCRTFNKTFFFVTEVPDKETVVFARYKLFFQASCLIITVML